jgi:hypothetical protein
MQHNTMNYVNILCTNFGHEGGRVHLSVCLSVCLYEHLN